MKSYTLDEMQCLDWIDDFYSKMYPVFGLNRKPNFQRYIEIAKENSNGVYFDHVKRELKRGERRLKNLAHMHYDKAYSSITGK